MSVFFLDTSFSLFSLYFVWQYFDTGLLLVLLPSVTAYSRVLRGFSRDWRCVGGGVDLQSPGVGGMDMYVCRLMEMDCNH